MFTRLKFCEKPDPPLSLPTAARVIGLLVLLICIICYSQALRINMLRCLARLTSCRNIFFKSGKVEIRRHESSQKPPHYDLEAIPKPMYSPRMSEFLFALDLVLYGTFCVVGLAYSLHNVWTILESQHKRKLDKMLSLSSKLDEEGKYCFLVKCCVPLPTD